MSDVPLASLRSPSALDTPPDHLLVICHGLWGNPSHTAYLATKIKEKHPNLLVLNTKSNHGQHTYDGIDWGAKRVVEEIKAEIEQSKTKITKFSIVGYSLGGLIARYVIGMLDQQQVFKDVDTVNFATFATPHLGLPRYANFRSKLTNAVTSKILGRSGRQLTNTDKFTKKDSLLSVLASPDHPFFRALAKFTSIRIYANAINDITVPYPTASISISDPFVRQVKVAINQDYPKLVDSFETLGYDHPHSSIPWFTNPNKIPVRPPLNYLIWLLIPVLLPLMLLIMILSFIYGSVMSLFRIRKLQSSHGRDSWIPGSWDSLPEVAVTVDAQMFAATQVKMCENLNTLPLQKHLMWAPKIPNAHAGIICRRGYGGEGIVAHWCDHFKMS